MTKQDLLTLESLLEKFDTQYSDEIHNDRFIALQTMKDTVNVIILEGTDEAEEITNYKYNLCSNKAHCSFKYTFGDNITACGGFSGTRCAHLIKHKENK